MFVKGQGFAYGFKKYRSSINLLSLSHFSQGTIYEPTQAFPKFVDLVKTEAT